MSVPLATNVRQVPGGPLSAGEIAFSRQARELLRAALDGGVPFISVVENLLADLRKLREQDFDVDAALASGFQPAIAAPALLSLRSGRQTQISAAERAFLEDLDGFLDFAMRNGLTFMSILSVVMHDVGAIANYKFDLEKAAADYFTPKASGWAKRNVEPVGEPEELLE